MLLELVQLQLPMLKKNYCCSIQWLCG